MTNLFEDPLPREITVDAQQRFLEEGLVHRTERGELVRSKSELVIADKLHARSVDYAYEQPLTLSNGRTKYPDFTIVDGSNIPLVPPAPPTLAIAFCPTELT